MLPRSTHTRSGEREAAPGKQSGRTQDPAPDRPLAALRVRPPSLLGERTIAHRLRRDPGRRRHAHGGDHRRLRRRARRGELAVSRRQDRHAPIRDFVAAVSVGIVQGTPLLDLESTSRLGLRHRHERRHDQRRRHRRIQGTLPRARPSRATRWTRWQLADQGIRSPVAAHPRRHDRPEPPAALRLCGRAHRGVQRHEATSSRRTNAASSPNCGCCSRRFEDLFAQPALAIARPRSLTRPSSRTRSPGAACGAGERMCSDRRRLRAVRRRARRRARRDLGALRDVGHAPAGDRRRAGACRTRPTTRCCSSASVGVAAEPRVSSCIAHWRYGARPTTPSRWWSPAAGTANCCAGARQRGLATTRCLHPMLARSVAELDATTKNAHSHRAPSPRAGWSV